VSHRVFVFGTLKEGFPNFATNRGRRIAGSFVTVQRHPLYLVGERFSPWLLDAAGEGERVIGQVFEVDPAALAAMDDLERVTQPDGYRRRPVEVEAVDAQQRQTVDAYFKPREDFDRSAARLGPLREYTAEHALLYRRR
jgi:gamma-glutamylaminecyclotransferase